MSRLGYWQSAWPVECGGNHRPKTVTGPGLAISPTDHLETTTRNIGGWPVMFVQRDHGELYLQGTTMADAEHVAGWVERVDPVTLRPINRSGDLPAGGHEWCGSVAVHANGDLYTVNGSYLHRLAPDCSIVAEAELPVDQAHNGLVILSDGSIATKDIRLNETASTLTICDPDLRVLATERLPEASMGRIASVGGGDRSAVGGSLSEVGDNIYVPGSTGVFRYHWDGSILTRDRSWQPTYRQANSGGLAWDPTVVDGRVWLMDNGNTPAVRHRFSANPPLRMPPGPGSISERPILPGWEQPVTTIGISVDDAEDVLRIAPTEHPNGWVIAPPLVSDGVVVAWDTGNTGIAAFDIASGPSPEMLWFQPFRTSMQPMLYPDTQELIINDFRLLDEAEPSDDIVVLDLRTGQMKARVPTGAARMNGMFLTPGWDRDLYYCSFGTVARIRVIGL